MPSSLFGIQSFTSLRLLPKPKVLSIPCYLIYSWNANIRYTTLTSNINSSISKCQFKVTFSVENPYKCFWCLICSYLKDVMPTYWNINTTYTHTHAHIEINTKHIREYRGERTLPIWEVSNFIPYLATTQIPRTVEIQSNDNSKKVWVQ